MEQSIKQVLQSQQVEIINDVLDRRGGGKTVGWHCKARSVIDYNETIIAVQKVINRNKLPLNISESHGKGVIEFFIMINQ